MAETVPEQSHSRSLVEHPERHHLIADVPIRPLVIILVVFVIAALIWHVALYGLFGVFEQEQQKENIPMTAVRTQPLATPEPRVQGIPEFHLNTPSADMEAMKRHNAEILGSYGKTTDPNFVRIPIDRAMDLTLERNMLPTQKGADASP